MIEVERSSEQKAAAARRALARRLEDEAAALRAGRLSPLQSVAAALVASVRTDDLGLGMTVRDACAALMPHAFESAATKRLARKVRKVYEVEWARMERVNPAELADLCGSAIASLTEAAHAA